MKKELDYRKNMVIFMPNDSTSRSIVIDNDIGRVYYFNGPIPPSFQTHIVYDFNHLTNQVVWC